MTPNGGNSVANRGHEKEYFLRLERLCKIWRQCRDKPAQTDEEEEGKQAPGTMRVLLVLGLPAVFALVVYAWQSGGNTLAVGTFTAISAFAAGALLGFLFGIPRMAPQHIAGGAAEDDGTPKPLYEPNTNLEQISDWLTKILVGVGLVQVGQIGGAVNDLADGLAPGLGKYGHAVAVMLMISFAITGFLGAYLFTRLRLQKAFEPSVIKAALKKQADTLTNPLPLVRSQLDPAGDKHPTLEELKEALRAASSGIREEAFYLARDQRRANWRGGDKHLVDLTIPVFEALIALDDDRHFHRNYGELGYALKDKAKPTSADYERARNELTTAIDIRGVGGAAVFPMYEFNRAFANIQLDSTPGAQKEEGDDRLSDAIYEDLEVAATTNSGRKAVKESRGALKKWLHDHAPLDERAARLYKLFEKKAQADS